MPPIERSFPAETLRAFRAWLGLSQDDLASILGISTRSVQAYEGLGGPEWMRYALLGWATLVHGATPRAAARNLGLPWEHHPMPGSAEASTEASAPADDELPDEPDAGDAAAADELGDDGLTDAGQSSTGRTARQVGPSR